MRNQAQIDPAIGSAAEVEARAAAFMRVALEAIEAERVILPSLPEIALRIRNAVQDPDASTADVASILQTDTAISARLVKVANCAAYRGYGSGVSQVSEAVSRLGLKPVQSLVTGLVILQIMRPVKGPLKRRLAEMQIRCLEVAALAAAIASRTGVVPRDQALLAGLLHDLGYLPGLHLAQSDPGLCGGEQTLDLVLHDVHPELGAMILSRWGMDAALVEAVRHHEHRDWASTDKPSLTDLLIVACAIQSFQHASVEHVTMEPANIPAVRRLAIDSLDDLYADPAFQDDLAQTRDSLGS